MRRVLFAGGGTGGHLYPALALADAMTALAADIEVHFVGARRGIEASVLPLKNVPHTLLPVEPLYRSRVWRNYRLAFSLAASLGAIAKLFRRFMPQLVVGTGGYASAPACLWAVTRRVPVAVQEQNAYPGMTTRLLARWAKQIHLGFPEAERSIRPGRRTRVFAHGNPIRPPDPSIDRAASRAQFDVAMDASVVLIVGGSQGSRAINEVVASAIERVARGEAGRPAGLELIWATGPSHIDAIRSRLAPLNVGGWVHASGYIDDMQAALAATDIAVSRAGAMMTAELLAWGIPAVLVPLATAAEDHQSDNARALESAGTSIRIPESSLTAVSLWDTLTDLVVDRDRCARMSAAARERARPGAASAIARELLTLLPAS
jgi:UDP-N-acetylglucosamine--N-acetylmuramyl-(pentapeptide) pyrophosphoryl-undecaprenol N-acetylglucosamine transferase